MEKYAFHEFEHSVSSRCQFSTNWAKDSIQCQSKFQQSFFFNWQAKIHWEMKRARIAETILKMKTWKIYTSWLKDFTEHKN